MIIQDFLGYAYYLQKIKLSLLFYNLKCWLKLNSMLKLKLFKLIREGSSKPLLSPYVNLKFYIEYFVHTLLNKMAVWRENIDM